MEKCEDYTNKVTLPAMGAISTEPQNQGVEVIDGCGCHISYNRMRMALERGLCVVLRVPHSTSVTQGEDTVLFRVLKPLFQKAKCRRLKIKAAANNNVPVPLDNDDLWACLEAGRALCFLIFIFSSTAAAFIY